MIILQQMLRSLQISNFRGIPSLTVRFDDLTVLLGENGCGKSTILAAITRCIGVGQDAGKLRFVPSDFSASGGAPPEIVLELTLSERAGKPWPSAWISQLGPVITRDGRRARQIRLRVLANLDPDTGRIDAEHCFVDASGTELPDSRNGELLSALRRLSPVLALGRNQSKLARAFRDLLPRGGAEMEPGSPVRLMTLGLERAASWAEHWDSLTPEQIKAGGAAAQQLWQRSLEQFASRWGQGTNRRSAIFPGSGVQRIIPLLWLRAVLEARGPGALDPGSLPIMILDHIEADLHPNMLRAMWYAVQSAPCQKIVTTYSGDLLAEVPLEGLRRLVRHRGVSIHGLEERTLSFTDRRKLEYHIRARRGGLLFSRCWLLVEGETEFWLLPEFAHICGVDLYAEGVNCVEFAQCGVKPLIKLADALGIRWHLVADGDRSGEKYASAAQDLCGSTKPQDAVTRLTHRDMERLLWASGYSQVYINAARIDEGPDRTIAGAIERISKPALALAVASAAAQPGSPGVPPMLRKAITAAVRLARESILD